MGNALSKQRRRRNGRYCERLSVPRFRGNDDYSEVPLQYASIEVFAAQLKPFTGAEHHLRSGRAYTCVATPAARAAIAAAG